MAIKAADQVSVLDLTDGYNVLLTNDSVNVVGGVSSLGTTTTVETTVVALRGTEKLTPTIGTITKTDTSVSVSAGTPSADGCKISVTLPASLTAAGSITIPVTVDESITINKVFSYSVSFKGATGATGAKGATGAAGVSPTVTNTKVEYQLSTSGTSVPTGTWSSTAVAPTTTQYCWTRTTSTYSDGKTAVSYSVGGKVGEKGATGAKGDTGATGAAGKDAITMAVTSSAGTIFKNTAIATTLTAHVYKAGVEVTGDALTALGSIKWYKDGGSTAVKTGQTLTISAGDVATKATYTAQLEG